MAPNNIGYVLEAEESRPDLETPFKVRLKVQLHNTLGKTKVFWVDAPDDVAGFFDTQARS